MAQEEASIRPFGPARSTVQGSPLSEDDVKLYKDYFQASCYLAVGMIYLRENPLLREPLRKEHLKLRLLGHFGSAPGQIFAYMHMNRIINKHDINAIFISGPGHGAPAVLSQSYLEGVYSQVYPDKSQDLDGMQRFFKYFSFPGGVGSHATPETPGSMHEGGELGYSLSHAFGAVFDHADLIALTMVGDGEAETGPLATAWHGNKFLNPRQDGAVLPILHLNGYKINNPTVLARLPHHELRSLMLGYGWDPYFVEGDDPDTMHQAMAATLEHCCDAIRQFQKQARQSNGQDKPCRPHWPMIVLRTPKGWTAPRKIDNHWLAGFWRSHQVPITDPASNPAHLKLLESWMRSYEPERLFDQDGRPIQSVLALCPTGNRRMSANPVTNGGLVRKQLRMPDFRDYAIKMDRPATLRSGSMKNMALLLRDIMKENPTNFRLFGPDETESNKLAGVYDAGKKVWMGEYFEEDADGGNLATQGRVMEMLSEHTVEGWLEGYVLTGRHGLLNSYEPFIHVIDSMVNQHCKWIEKCLEVEWRTKVSSLNLLLTSLVWRQDHNGFSHQDPGFLDVVANKSPEVVRIYLPPDGNCLLSVMDHCLKSVNYVNVIVSDKQDHLQYLNMEQAIEHCTKGIGIWSHFSTDAGLDVDIVMASCGDISTQETLAAIDLLLQHFPSLHIRYVNCVDLFKLIHPTMHPHGLSDREWTALFTNDTPIIFNFHSYPWLVHRLTYKRPNSHKHLHVRGYCEKGNIDTPLELAIRNKTDRFSLAIDAIDYMENLHNRGAAAREALVNAQIKARNEAWDTGMDPVGLTQWVWPEEKERTKAQTKLASR
ncbi:hypothetical protein CDD81_3716 [Ophiocordyceps australis]|uniref:Xylulose 5-phosphate/Fructose 6-phosphate phosphoketolase N-terminal domain-containing protein n=1 Tax=Ophiocordyceps australis TaxID=1399860 RepID=A0A2C5XVZ3_9HYPO|nr:hypothetical protein CDD81_3716 [Ophiocordyceps australis]